MKKKHYLIFQTFLSGASALFFLSVPFWFSGEYGYIFLLLAAVSVYSAIKNFKLIKDAKDGERVYAPDTGESIPEQIKFYKTSIHIAIVSSAILSIMTVLDLNDFISGNQEYVQLYTPVSFAYQHFGY